MLLIVLCDIVHIAILFSTSTFLHGNSTACLWYWVESLQSALSNVGHFLTDWIVHLFQWLQFWNWRFHLDLFRNIALRQIIHTIGNLFWFRSKIIIFGFRFQVIARERKGWFQLWEFRGASSEAGLCLCVWWFVTTRIWSGFTCVEGWSRGMVWGRGVPGETRSSRRSMGREG